jgi:hypothetical protein
MLRSFNVRRGLIGVCLGARLAGCGGSSLSAPASIGAVSQSRPAVYYQRRGCIRLHLPAGAPRRQVDRVCLRSGGVRRFRMGLMSTIRTVATATLRSIPALRVTPGCTTVRCTADSDYAAMIPVGISIYRLRASSTAIGVNSFGCPPIAAISSRFPWLSNFTTGVLRLPCNGTGRISPPRVEPVTSIENRL